MGEPGSGADRQINSLTFHTHAPTATHPAPQAICGAIRRMLQGLKHELLSRNVLLKQIPFIM